MTNISYIKNKERRLNWHTVLPYIRNCFYFNTQNVITIAIDSDYETQVGHTGCKEREYYFKNLIILKEVNTEIMQSDEWRKLINLYDAYFDIDKFFG